MVSSFRDALTRQLSEAVRIELRWEDILNSKSEFNRCKVPRLKIDLEGWRKEKEIGKEVTNPPECQIEEEDLTRRMEMEFENEVSLAEMEDSARRGDGKRKDDGTWKVRKAKKIKLEKLINWGMEEEGYCVEQAEETTGVSDWIVKKKVSLITKDWLLAPIISKPWSVNLHQATLKIQKMTSFQTAGESIKLFPPPDPVLTAGGNVKTPTRSSLEESPKTINACRTSIEEGSMNMPTGSLSNTVFKEQGHPGKMKPFPKDGKFKFNKKGKLKEKEKMEIRRTSKNIFDWFKSGTMNINQVATDAKEKSEKAAKNEMLMEINRKREEARMKAARMERLNVKRKEWDIQSICNSIVNGLVDSLDIFGIKSWMTDIDAVGMDRGRFAKRWRRSGWRRWLAA